jgi:hypothetical protein
MKPYDLRSPARGEKRFVINGILISDQERNPTGFGAVTTLKSQ